MPQEQPKKITKANKIKSSGYIVRMYPLSSGKTPRLVIRAGLHWGTQDHEKFYIDLVAFGDTAMEINNSFSPKDDIIVTGYLKSKLQQPQMSPAKKCPDMVMEIIVEKMINKSTNTTEKKVVSITTPIEDLPIMTDEDFDNILTVKQGEK